MMHVVMVTLAHALKRDGLISSASDEL